ncbi:hypothetical protein N7523_003422 [Penicillium sp. IBT 18751x]|nr:hypothetical protein N7523_003422 [Penicillium sp. IBT 18751x]
MIAADPLDDTQPSEDRSINWRLLLPEYARPLSLAITRKDCSVLLQKGAFDIPQARIRDELLRSYIQFVHPALPILDLENFLMVIDKSYTGGVGISFLLFQAVIFAATRFESEESLATEGFQNQREARKTRFDRIRMLYSFGCEDDRVTVLQTLLLMTYWDNNSEDLHDAWHFVGVGTKVWRSIKTKPKSLEAELKRQKPELWKRISWSLYMRDRLVAFYTRQPFHIDEADFRTPLLHLSDLKVGPLSTECCLGGDGSHPAIRDPSMHRLLAQISIALVQFCKCITRILNCHYTVFRRQICPEITLKEFLVPKRVSPTSAELLLRDSGLEEWHDSLPELLRWYPSNPLHQINKHADVVLHFRAMLNGVYNLACSTLHRPQIASTLRIPELVDLSSQRMHYSAMTITKSYTYFKQQGLEWLLPDGQVAMLESAIITYSGDLESLISLTRQEAMENFRICAQALKQLGGTYPSADQVLASVEAAVMRRKSPVQSIGMPSTFLLNTEELGHNNQAVVDLQPVDGSKRAMEPNIQQEIAHMSSQRMGELLCSHFMMTPSEKSMLQGLVMSEVDNSEFYFD